MEYVYKANKGEENYDKLLAAYALLKTGDTKSFLDCMYTVDKRIGFISECTVNTEKNSKYIQINILTINE